MDIVLIILTLLTITVCFFFIIAAVSIVVGESSIWDKLKNKKNST